VLPIIVTLYDDYIRKRREPVGLCGISGFYRKVDDNYLLLGHYGASNCNSLRTFRDNLPATSSKKMGPIGCPETSVRNYNYSLRSSPEERSCPLSAFALKTKCGSLRVVGLVVFDVWADRITFILQGQVNQEEVHLTSGNEGIMVFRNVGNDTSRRRFSS
jgi:hypothetical protein